MEELFQYERRVAFCDTDAMGVTHHANYLRFLEEARVAWMRIKGLSHVHYPQADRVMALLHYQVWHLQPSRFEDVLTIQLQTRRLGARVHYQYKISKEARLIAEAETMHIPVDNQLKPVKISRDMLQAMEREQWIETWLLNS